MGNNSAVIKTVHLNKSFGNFRAVKDINLSVSKGEIFALIGENGAGKTTLIKMLVGLFRPTSGKVYILGYDIENDELQAKKNFGYVSDDPNMYGYLTGWEFLYMTGNLRKIPHIILEKRIKKLENLFPVENILDEQIGSYSRGNKQKVAFLAALLSEPPILFIDEPVAGLDPPSMRIFGKTIQEYTQKGNTVFLISHSLPFVKEYAQRVGVMHEGKLIKEEVQSRIRSLEKFTQRT